MNNYGAYRPQGGQEYNQPSPYYQEGNEGNYNSSISNKSFLENLVFGLA